MTSKLRNKLINIAKDKITNHDRSHDFYHALRVLNNAEGIVEYEGGDLDIIVPAALFHDIVCYQKNHPKSNDSSEESAETTKEILENIDEFPRKKIGTVFEAINQCSFSKSINPNTLEAKILQDADRLEATGAISIMRTFSSTGQMERPFYHPTDPFCRLRKPDSKKQALDLFYSRLLVVQDRMHTKYAKKLAKKRTKFLKQFLKELAWELGDISC
ncbi:MAG: HD domain-containing protein [Candidatus Paceibacterota bacterium]|jgi:uncharacterized protein